MRVPTTSKRAAARALRPCCGLTGLTRVAALAVLLAWLQAGAAAGAQEPRSWAVTAGARLWYTDWVDQTDAFEIESDFIVAPSLRFRWNRFSAGLSYSSGDFHGRNLVADRDVDLTRTDVDVALSYSLTPSLGPVLGLGLKRIELDPEGSQPPAELAFDGLSAGLLYTRPIGEHFLISGLLNAMYCYRVPDGFDESFGFNAEVNLGYAVGNVVHLLGYRYQTLEASEDRFNGLTFAVLYQF